MEFKILNDINDEIIAMRTEAFIKQRGVAENEEFDGRDSELLHFCLYDDGKLVASLRAEELEGFIHIGRVAVLTELRKSGYGRKLIDYLLQYAKDKEFEFVELSAVKTAQGFYEKAGFSAEGDYYLETGVPHIYMKKKL